MEVLFLTLYPITTASTRQRIYNYIGYLESYGIKCRVCPAVRLPYFSKWSNSSKFMNKLKLLVYEILNRSKDILISSRYDIVFIQKGLSSFYFRGILSLLRLLNGKIIFDFDDAVYLGPPQKFSSILSIFQDKNQISRIIKTSKYVIAGNNNLAQYARKFNQNVTVIPTCLNTDIYKPKKRRKHREEVIIGWCGSAGTNPYVNQIKNILNKLGGEYSNITFRIISENLKGVNLADFHRIIVDFKKWDFKSMVEDLQNFDIGVMPLVDNEWNRGKCAGKILEYMALGIPAVCSPVGVNSEIIRDGVNGFLADSEEEWVEKLSLLIENPDLRYQIGMKGRQTVEERYSVKINAPKLKEIIECVAGRIN